MLDYNTFTDTKYDSEFYNNLFLEFFNLYYESDIISINERKYIEESVPLNEEFFDKLKDRYDKAKTVVKNFSNDAKNSLEKIIDAAKDATDFIKSMVNNISASINNIMTKTKDKITEKLKNSNEIVTKIKEIKDKNAIINELKDSKELIKFYNDKFIKNLIDKVKSSINGVVSSEEGVVSEKNIDGFMNPKNVIAKLVHGLESIPPFSWLDNVKEIGEKGANKVFGAISNFTENLGGPSIQLPLLAGLLGIAIEVEVKGLIKGGLLDAVAFYTIPFVSILIKVIGWIATFISLTLVVDMVLDLKMFAHH